MTGFGGTYAVPISAVACLFELVPLLRRPRADAFVALAVAGLLGLGLAAFRLWPVWETLQRAPRVIGGMSGSDWKSLQGLLFGYSPLFETEAWFLVGVGVLPAAIAALWQRRGIFIALAAGVCLWLALGYSASPSLFALLRLLPVYAMLRSPERFLIVFALLTAVLAGRGLTLALALPRLKRFRAAGWAKVGWAVLSLALVCNLGLLIHNFKVAAGKRTLVAPPVAIEQPFHQTRGNRWAAAYFPPMNRGSLSCWDAYPVPQSPALRGDLQHEEYLEDASAGSVDEKLWSPNRIDLSLQLTRPGRLIVNQNHHTGWHASVGTVVNDHGRLAVDLPAGSQDLRLSFLPRSAVGGGAATAAALASCWLLLRRRRGRGWVLAVAAAPLLVGLGAGALVSEPPFVAEENTGPAGEAIVADALPIGAQQLGVSFEGGVVLEGAMVTPLEDNTVRFELDWRVTDPVAPHQGIFVHVQPDSGDRLTADHALVSDALFLEEAPRGKILRDIQILSVSPAQRSKGWKLWVGLWLLRGNGARMKVLSRGNAEVDDNRVLAGTVAR
jgi:hypothetical protein